MTAASHGVSEKWLETAYIFFFFLYVVEFADELHVKIIKKDGSRMTKSGIRVF